MSTEHPDVQIIETGDSVKVKQVLDECVTEAIKKGGYQINYNLENLKLFLMFVCCVFAMLAQFYPSPFPQNLSLLGVCCGRSGAPPAPQPNEPPEPPNERPLFLHTFSYFALSTIVQGIVTFVEKDRIIVTKASEVYLCF